MEELKERYLRVKKRILDQEFSRMNARQREAIFSGRGPLLILAGAGSGKTTVIVNRIAYLLKYGDTYHCEELPFGLTEFDVDLLEEYLQNPNPAFAERVSELIANRPVSPWSILAITFTNKAANELKERLIGTVGESANDIWANTFHGACAKMLRRDIERLGYTRDFTVYDTDDQKRLIKECTKMLNLNEKNYPVYQVLSVIGRAKDKLLSPGEFAESAKSDYRLSKIASIYKLYQQRLEAANALDFDDMIRLTVKLLAECDDVREYYQKKFQYILCDEYQDTNYAQYALVSLLAEQHRNLTVVGDDDQSIYKFRGATIENILSFEEQYKEAKTIRLEQNYRSTQVILDAANQTIKHNVGRKGKTLWTENPGGEKIKVFKAKDEYAEGVFIAEKILDEVVRYGKNYRDFAVLYRANAQSSAIETALQRSGIAYKLFGGYKFYERKEVKDVISYLGVLCNRQDDLRLKRIINEPKRGIGDTTVDVVEALAVSSSRCMYDVLAECGEYEQLARSREKLTAFYSMMEELRAKRDLMAPSLFASEVLSRTGYMEFIIAQDKADGRERAQNIETLLANIQNYEENAEAPSLTGFMEEASLATDWETQSEDGQYVSLLTIHSAKGLEFPVVFLAGMEEEVFPSSMAMQNPDEIEEERRLCYVAITRAKQRLYLSYAANRRTYQGLRMHFPSRFLKEMPTEYLDILNQPEPVHTYAAAGTAAKAPKNPIYNYRAGSSLLSGKKAPEPTGEEYRVGDTVQHAAFGQGVVLMAKKMGGDWMLEIAFEKTGTKKLMANYAKLTKPQAN
ncbi:ATP-dependent helicase [Feifania hominis]|uniref:ATP-dependent DNA helicase PcrA n=1 Tax=Feifania hominis TaxID=2763660 RepID=A0A926DC99_9FIRM|nr:UvrD-helicase domain-containing protein [Feifania hominis]MBC8535453.1 UvrD-helicase domain-containing protein [Feifania hominis]